MAADLWEWVWGQGRLQGGRDSQQFHKKTMSTCVLCLCLCCVVLCGYFHSQRECVPFSNTHACPSQFSVSISLSWGRALMSILHLISSEKSQLSDSSVHLTWQLTPVSGSRGGETIKQRCKPKVGRKTENRFYRYKQYNDDQVWKKPLKFLF